MTVQKENGYTAIANELVDEMCKLHLSGNEWQIVFTVLRKTWGWNKKKDMISLTQFEKETGLTRSRVSEALAKLVRKSVLLVQKEKHINIYSFNKLYKEWNSTEKRTTDRVVRKSVRGSTEKRNEVVRKSVPTKAIITKDTITKEINTSVTNVTEGNEVNRLLTMFKEVNPSYKQLYPNKGQRLALERMINEHGLERVEQLISSLPLVVGKQFAPTITTPFELEKKLGSYLAYIKRENVGSYKFSVEKV